MSEKRNNLPLKSEKGKRRLSGWDNIIWKLKKKPNAPFSLLPILLNPEEGNPPPKFCKGKEDSTIPILLHPFFGRGWGLRFSPSSSPHPKTGLNPTSGRCWERLPRKFCSRDRGGCFLEGERLQGRWGGGTERGL